MPKTNTIVQPPMSAPLKKVLTVPGTWPSKASISERIFDPDKKVQTKQTSSGTAPHLRLKNGLLQGSPPTETPLLGPLAPLTPTRAGQLDSNIHSLD